MNRRSALKSLVLGTGALVVPTTSYFFFGERFTTPWMAMDPGANGLTVIQTPLGPDWLGYKQVGDSNVWMSPDGIRLVSLNGDLPEDCLIL